MTILWIVLALVLGAAAVMLWMRTHPDPFPYGLRFFTLAPHPLITRKRLREILAPAPGERILEVGPGTGYYTLEMAESVGAEGSVDIFDIRQEFLDHVMRRAQQRRVKNIRPTQGDAQSLPYEDGSFDAAVLITVLGEIPDQAKALGELRRALAPGGRLMVGELAFPDPHFLRFGPLRKRVEAAGFRFERRSGPGFGYFARFDKPG